jgi:hypothetical protein
MKDAKGHGSEKGRGGGPHPWQRTGGWGSSAVRDHGSPPKGPSHSWGPPGGTWLSGTGQTQKVDADAWSNTPGGDREAANTLSSGGPKSEPAPVHEAMHHAMHNAISGPSYTGNATGSDRVTQGKLADTQYEKRNGMLPGSAAAARSMKIDGREG